MLNIWHFTTETFLRAYIENSNTMKHCIFVSKKNDKSIDVSKSYYFFLNQSKLNSYISATFVLPILALPY